jgi:hypothetical protein
VYLEKRFVVFCSMAQALGAQDGHRRVFVRISRSQVFGRMSHHASGGRNENSRVDEANLSANRLLLSEDTC